MKLRPMLQVNDVAVSSRWYQQMLGLLSGHGGEDYEMLFADEDFVLQLHRLDAHEHGILDANTDGVRGAGASLWFEVDDKPTFDSMIEKAEAAGAEVAEPPKWNPLAHHYEATMVDPDGYIVVINTPFSPEA